MTGIELQLFPRLFIPFVGVTIIITICGYLINDYFDFESDINNHKSHKLSNRGSYLYTYLAFFVIGFLMAFIIASQIGKPLLSLIYLGASGLLLLYSSHFKKMPLIGNIVVSIFSAFVILILLYAEWDAYQTLKTKRPEIYATHILLIISYSSFAFLVSLMREIVKDIEDYAGDLKVGYNTLPIAIGSERSKMIAGLSGVMLLFIMGIWAYKMLANAPFLLIILFVLLCLRMAYTVFKIFNAHNTKAYKLISSQLKWIMLMGLAFLIIYYQWI